MATIYKTDGSSVEIDPKNGKYFELEELQDVVNGFIETVHLKDGQLMVVNEEGKLLDLSYNRKASMLYKRDIIVGNALVCEKGQVK